MDGLCHVYGDSLQKVEIGIVLLSGCQRDFHGAIISYTICTLQHLGYIGNAPWGFNKKKPLWLKL